MLQFMYSFQLSDGDWTHLWLSLVFQVANLSGKENTFTLKDFMYKEIQKDWPGYSEGDQQLLKRILFRYVRCYKLWGINMNDGWIWMFVCIQIENVCTDTYICMYLYKISICVYSAKFHPSMSADFLSSHSSSHREDKGRKKSFSESGTLRKSKLRACYIQTTLQCSLHSFCSCSRHQKFLFMFSELTVAQL